MKTNKSYLKRIRVTRRGKLVVRSKGQGAFNAKESAKTKSAKGRATSLVMGTRLRRRFLPGM